MSYLGRATGIKLARDIKGTNTLTFQMPTKFFDSEKGDFVKNEYIEELFNERKVKLKFQKQWYEFYIKKISESKQFKAIMKTFTCDDSFIDELSRTGYGITFDTELYNNVDELGNFSEIIIEDSIWDYRPDFNWGDFTEFTEQRFYKIPLDQFGGSISAYPIILTVTKNDLLYANNTPKPYLEKRLADEGLVWVNMTAEEKEKFVNNEITLTNIYTHEKRPLEYGDDMSRVEEIFWDPYKSDNGSSLWGAAETLSGGYIYVPISDLSYIYGSAINDPYKATETPAYYGTDDKKGYALQPYSNNPKDLIQFIYFPENADIEIDESGTVVNNNYHYIMTIDAFSKSAGHNTIHWKDADDTYRAITPDTSLIDNFNWNPVYYEGYLDKIGETEVFKARKISVTDRTEYNLDKESYVTVYNNSSEEYKNLYSEKELETLVEKGQDFRVCSNLQTRLVMPTLARNLVQNGTNISKTDGWDSLTQKSETSTNTGRFETLLEFDVKTAEQNITGQEEDQGISDYYLEILSPKVLKGNSFDLEGESYSDYLLNFGLIGQEKIIEKDKIYALRMCTGINYPYKGVITCRGLNGTEVYTIAETVIVGDVTEEKIRAAYQENIDGVKNIMEEHYKAYVDTVKSYGAKLMDESVFGTVDYSSASEQDFKDLLNTIITTHDEGLTKTEQLYAAVTNSLDYGYLIALWKKKENPNNLSESANPITDTIVSQKESIVLGVGDKGDYNLLNQTTINSWIKDILKNTTYFIKMYNTDLDKILIGQGSIDLNGNYTLDGNNNLSGDYISFSDLFDSENEIAFINEFYGEDALTNEDVQNKISKTYYHNKENGKWEWGTSAQETNVPDTSFLLFKATKTIENPYIGIKVSSSPLSINIKELKVKKYDDTSYKGVKLQLFAKRDGQPYLVDGLSFICYKLTEKNFEKSFLESLGTLDDAGNLTLRTDIQNVAYQDSYLKANAYMAWSGKSLSDNNLYFTKTTLMIENTAVNEDKSDAFALFISDGTNKTFYGAFQLVKG